MKSPACYAIGDVHGCAETLRFLLWNILKISPKDKLIFLGDLIDRGPDAKGVLNEILQLKQKGFEVVYIRGNHEEIMLNAFVSNKQHDYWCKVGGQAVLESFLVDSIMDIPDEYVDLLDQSIDYFEYENYFFVHAGLNFDLPNPLADTHAMRWIRQMPEKNTWLKSRRLIHGHTPEPLNKIINNQGPIINLDGGCVYKDNENLGFLIALDVLSGQFFYTRNCEQLVIR